MSSRAATWSWFARRWRRSREESHPREFGSRVVLTLRRSARFPALGMTRRFARPAAIRYKCLTMNSSTCTLLAALFVSSSLLAEPPAEKIDMEKAKAIYERQKAGETLSADDRAYLQRAIEQHKQASGKGPRGDRYGQGEGLVRAGAERGDFETRGQGVSREGEGAAQARKCGGRGQDRRWHRHAEGRKSCTRRSSAGKP